MKNNKMNSIDVLGKPLELPCGAILKNRLVKAPMSDSLGDGRGEPTEAQIRLYERWAEGGAALSIIGEVQSSCLYPERPGNLILGPDMDIVKLKSLSGRAAIDGAHIWPQLGHGGALSYSAVSRPKGPSPLGIEDLKCDGMSLDEVKALPRQYAQAAGYAKSAGFTGIQIHAGHGFLLSQFLSPLFNRRKDGYGGSIEARSRVLVEIIDEVRRTVGPELPIGIKINSSDNLEGGLTEDEALVLIGILDSTSIDLIDISGGTYFPGAKASSDAAGRGPYFVDFARRARRVSNIPLMVTGGFKTREQAVSAIVSGAADMVGVGRGMVLNPGLGRVWLRPEGGEPDFPGFDNPPPGSITAWYTMRLAALAVDREGEYDMDPATALRFYEERDKRRCTPWRERFSLPLDRAD